MTSAPGWADSGPEAVTAAIHRIPLPLPTDGLRAVNVYAIEDSGGLVLVDAGWALDEARRALEAGLATIGHDLGEVTRFLITHAHRDHYTLGVALRREFGMKLAAGLGEQPTLQRLAQPELDLRTDRIRTLVASGADPLAAELAAQPAAELGLENWELPDEWLIDRQLLELADRTLEVIATPGHTRGHVVFIDRAEALMFAGDHVLPHITPSIGLEASLPVRELPLAAYLDSLALMNRLPDLRLLPAHGEIRPSVQARVAELQDHHARRLAQTLAAVRGGARTAYQTAEVLTWTRRERSFDSLDLFNRILAVSETEAHLDVLAEREDLSRADSGGVIRYEP